MPPVLWKRGIYPQYFAFCRTPSQPDPTKVPLSDRNVLLDHYLSLLPLDQNSVQKDLFRIRLGCCTKPRLRGAGFPTIRLAELPLPVHRARRATVVHAWSSDRIDSSQQGICPSPCPRHRRVSGNFPVQGQPEINLLSLSFIAWYYYIAPSYMTFAAIRRTLTLTNLFAFLTFTLYPCMPPRLLPPEYGFVDSVRHDNATSIWMSGDYVNSLAAMPSMHFGYSFVIGCTMIYHSGSFRHTMEKAEAGKSLVWKSVYVLIGLGYPSIILVTIVATANHYWLDAFMATIVASLAYLCNPILLTLLPLEDLLLWLLRLEKPVPSTGDRFRQRSGIL